MPSIFQYFVWFSLTFPVCSKFPDFSLTGKCLPIFPGFPVFPVRVGTLPTHSLVKICLFPHSIAITKDFAQASVDRNLYITNGTYSLRTYFHYFGIANAYANSMAIAQCEWTLRLVFLPFSFFLKV